MSSFSTLFLFVEYVAVVDHLKFGASTFVVFTISSTPLLDMLPIGKN